MHILSLRAQVAALWLAWALAASVAALPGLALRLVRVLAPPLVRLAARYGPPLALGAVAWVAWLLFR